MPQGLLQEGNVGTVCQGSLLLLPAITQAILLNSTLVTFHGLLSCVQLAEKAAPGSRQAHMGPGSQRRQSLQLNPPPCTRQIQGRFVFLILAVNQFIEHLL